MSEQKGGRFASNPVLRSLKKAALFLWGGISRNLGMKLLSIALAVLLWNYVITTNSSITRTRTVTGLTGYITGQSALNTTYGLALLDDPLEQLSNIAVRVEVPQADFAKVSQDNVQVTLDLSSVRTTGLQQVPLKATSSYGRVVSIAPDRLSLTFEAMDSRSVPVNVVTVGEGEDDRWYNVLRSNPTVLTIRGAASVVQSLASAQVTVDIDDERSSFTIARPYVLLDGEGEEISQSMLERSASSISVNVGVYPTREIDIATDIGSTVTGQPAEGYYVDSVSVQPEKLVVAADQELLDSLTELHIEPINVDGASQSFSAKASVTALSSFRSISADEVYVTVNIVEEKISVWIENVPINYINLGENLDLNNAPSTVRVLVTGPRSQVAALSASGMMATINLEGLAAGEYTLTPDFNEDSYPEIMFTTERSGVSLELSEQSAPDEEAEIAK